MFRRISQVTIYRLMIRTPYVYFRCYYLEFIITIRRIIRTNWTMDTLAIALGGQRVKIWYLKKPSKIIFKSLIAHLVFELGIFKKHTLRRGVCTLKKVIIWPTVFTLNYEIGLQSHESVCPPSSGMRTKWWVDFDCPYWPVVTLKSPIVPRALIRILFFIIWIYKS